MRIGMYFSLHLVLLLYLVRTICFNGHLYVWFLFYEFQHYLNKYHIMQIAVIGLGYVGLPLARLFSTKYQTIGFDMNQKRVESLMGGMILL